MGILIIKLTAAFVDYPATPSARTKVEITLENSTGRLSVKDCEGSPRSVHQFTVRDAIDLGCKGVHRLTEKQAELVLAISCSLKNPHVLFSTLQPNQFSPSLKPGKEPSKKVEIVGTPTRKHIAPAERVGLADSVSMLLTNKLNLDEAQVLNVANSLLAYRIFDETNRSRLELNVLGSIKQYGEAPRSAEGLSCYMSLYSAFEKAINADTNRTNRSFDAAASASTGLTEADIERLRHFNNRVKHASRNEEDVVRLKAGEARLGQLALNLKKAADSAILSRIS
jgi:hypothetical protein